jgi:hypothetical protein
LTRPALRFLALALVAAIVLAAVSVRRVEAGSTTRIVGRQVSGSVDRVRTFELPLAPHHVALHWRGKRSARVRVAFSDDGTSFGRARKVALDEVGEQRRNGETYGAVMAAGGARTVRVYSDRRLARLTVLAMADGRRQVRRRWRIGGDASAAVDQPPVISRAGWGADESLRFKNGQEVWPPEFHPVQKLIVHHTATKNGDPDPAATIRSIYYYHAVTQGWGDIGYNFLVDESGRIYEGRYSRSYAPGEYPTGEDLAGNGVTGAHAQGFNSGTVGAALLGTLTDRDATAAARDALERFLAWKAERHGIDPKGSSLYVNPVNGTQKTFPNIAGHRDLNATECPGNVFYSSLPALRDAVAARIAGTPPDTTPPAPPSGLTAVPDNRKVKLDWADNAEGDLAGYRVYRRSSDGTWPSSPLASATVSAFTNTGLKNGTTYTYRVTAYDGSGNESAPSAAVAATPRRR